MAKGEECSCEETGGDQPKTKQAVEANSHTAAAAQHSAKPHESHAKHNSLLLPSQEEMAANLLPLGSRDACAHLLIPLNKCRADSFYLPWKCVDERHVYEKCEYELFLKRVRKMEQLRGYREASS